MKPKLPAPIFSEKYHRRFEKVLSSVEAGRFLQIENQLTLFIDMTIAREMPPVGKPGVKIEKYRRGIAERALNKSS